MFMQNQKNDAEIKQTETSQKKIVQHPFWDLILEIIEFGIMCFVIAEIMFVIFVLIIGWDEVFNNYMTIAKIMFQPSFFGVFILWILITKRKKFKDIIMGKPKFPEKGHRWFYYFFVIGWFSLLADFFVFLATGLISFEPKFPDFGLDIYSLFWAATGEEIIFRGYLYLRCEDIYGKNKIYYEWNYLKRDENSREVKEQFMTFEITYAAILSSVFFASVHFMYLFTWGPISLFIGFVGGLLFCKFRNETDSLVIAMIFHWMYDFGISLINATVFFS